MSCDERWVEKIGRKTVMIMTNARLRIITHAKVINGFFKTQHLYEISNPKSTSTLLRYHYSSTSSIVVALLYVALVMFVTALGEMKIKVKAQNAEFSNEDKKQVGIVLGLDELSAAMILKAFEPQEFSVSSGDYISERISLLNQPFPSVTGDNYGSNNGAWCLGESYVLVAGVDHMTDAVHKLDKGGEHVSMIIYEDKLVCKCLFELRKSTMELLCCAMVAVLATLVMKLEDKFLSKGEAM